MHYTIPSLEELKESPDSCSLQVIKQKEVNQFSLLTKNLENLSH